VSPGTELTGFDLEYNTIVYGTAPTGTVTAGLGTVSGTIYAAGDVAAQAQADALIAYNYLVSQVADTTYGGVTQLDGMTLTPGVYKFAPSANLITNGTLTLDFQGNADAVFIFKAGTTVVTEAGSKVVAINNPSTTCDGANVFWAVGSSATLDGAQFIGTVIANTTITMTSGANVSGRIIALNGAVTMIEDTIAVCESTGTGTGTGGGTGSGGGGSVCDSGGWNNGSSYTSGHSWGSWWGNWFKNIKNNYYNGNNKNDRNNYHNGNNKNDRHNKNERRRR
jgi:hypothetical protein